MTEPEKIAEAVVARLREIPDERPLYSVETLAVRLGLSTRTVRDMLKLGTIPSFIVQNTRKIDPEAVDAYLESMRRAEVEG